MKLEDIKKMADAWMEATNKESQGQFIYAAKQAKKNGEKTFTFAGKEYEVEEALKDAKEMDPVNKKAAQKDFDDRKDKDIDNDGDVDDSDEYLHKRRKAIGKAMKKDKPVGNDGEKKAEISKIGEATKELLGMLESAAKKSVKSSDVAPEGIMDKESPKSKQFAKDHEKSDKEIEDMAQKSHDAVSSAASDGTKPKSGKRPQDNATGDMKPVKSTEAPTSGKGNPEGDTKSNPYDGRLKSAKEFLNRMAKRKGMM